MSLREWAESRTGIGEAVTRFLLEEIPASAGWPQIFGSVAVFVLLVQACTGILLAFNFAASAGDAYDSVSYIMRDVTGGRTIRGLHHWGASMMMVVVVAHAAQVFLYGAYKKPREVTWLCGVILLLLVAGFSLTGYLLPWDNRAYWGTVVTTEIAGQAPVLGAVVQRFLGAENGVGVVTFTRFYALHVLVLPAMTVLLTGVHLFLIRKHGVTPSASDDRQKVHFYPGQAIKDTLAMFFVLAALITAALFADIPLERVADPSDATYVPRPEWYFLFLFQTLKFFHGALEPIASVGLPSLAVLLLTALPFIDRSSASDSLKKRWWAAAVCVLAFAGWGALTLAALSGTPSSAIAVKTQVEDNRVLSLAPVELAGFDSFRHSTCNACHNLIEGDPKQGPTLAIIKDRRPPEWVEAHVRSEAGVRGGSPQRPSPAELNALVQLVSKVSPTSASDLQAAPADLLEGAALFNRNLCQSCHRVNGWGGKVGPSLNGLASRRSRSWVERHFAQPGMMSPGTVMPPYHFAPDEQRKLINYLFELP